MDTNYSSRQKSSQLHNIINNIDRLRPLPTTTLRIIKATDDESTTAGLVSEIISLDQALTFEVLKFANSVQLGYVEENSSVERAVMRLGFKRIRALAMKSFAGGPLSQRLVGYRLGADALWHHSLTTATYAERIARAIYYPSPEDAYVGGLLHDIGKLVMDQYISMGYQKIVEIMRSHKKHVWEVEEIVFGIDHAGVGGLMAEKWKLPKNMAQIIEHHHMPSAASTHQDLAAIVNIANSFTPIDSNSLTGLDGRFINPASLEILDMSLSRVNELWKYIVTKSEDNPSG